MKEIAPDHRYSQELSHEISEIIAANNGAIINGVAVLGTVEPRAPHALCEPWIRAEFTYGEVTELTYTSPVLEKFNTHIMTTHTLRRQPSAVFKVTESAVYFANKTVAEEHYNTVLNGALLAEIMQCAVHCVSIRQIEIARYRTPEIPRSKREILKSAGFTALTILGAISPYSAMIPGTWAASRRNT